MLILLAGQWTQNFCGPVFSFDTGKHKLSLSVTAASSSHKPWCIRQWQAHWLSIIPYNLYADASNQVQNSQGAPQKSELKSVKADTERLWGLQLACLSDVCRIHPYMKNLHLHSSKFQKASYKSCIRWCSCCMQLRSLTTLQVCRDVKKNDAVRRECKRFETG